MFRPVLRGAAWAARGLRVPARNTLLADVVPADAFVAAGRVRTGRRVGGSGLAPITPTVEAVRTTGMRTATALRYGFEVSPTGIVLVLHLGQGL